MMISLIHNMFLHSEPEQKRAYASIFYNNGN